MPKDAYYFTHDTNASSDPKIAQLLSVYGFEGYGWYWRLIEMLREQGDHKLSLAGKYVYHGFAKAMLSTPDGIAKFIDDCINEFYLFTRDGDYFWSESLNRRIELYEQSKNKYSAAGKKGAQSRWHSDAITTPLENDGIVTENDGIKVKESKVNNTIVNNNSCSSNDFPSENINDEVTSITQELFDLYENNIGLITPIIQEEIRAALKIFPPEKIEFAINEATKKNHRSWSYIAGVLNNQGSGAGKSPQNKSSPPDDASKYTSGEFGRHVHH